MKKGMENISVLLVLVFMSIGGMIGGGSILTVIIGMFVGGFVGAATGEIIETSRWLNTLISVFKNEYEVTVDYGLSLKDMIAAGKYDYVSAHDINCFNQNNFPPEYKDKEVDLVIKLICFDRTMESKDIAGELDVMGLRPATLPELLAFSATYPKKKRNFDIIAMDSICQLPNTKLQVVFFLREYSQRFLCQDWLNSWWGGECRFAAVPN